MVATVARRANVGGSDARQNMTFQYFNRPKPHHIQSVEDGCYWQRQRVECGNRHGGVSQVAGGCDVRYKSATFIVRIGGLSNQGGQQRGVPLEQRRCDNGRQKQC